MVSPVGGTMVWTRHTDSMKGAIMARITNSTTRVVPGHCTRAIDQLENLLLAVDADTYLEATETAAIESMVKSLETLQGAIAERRAQAKAVAATPKQKPTPVVFNPEGKSVKELRAEAKTRGVKGYSKLSKAQLVAALG